jgi:hypothetical protein
MFSGGRRSRRVQDSATVAKRPLAPLVLLLLAPACSTLLGVDFGSATARPDDAGSGDSAVVDGAVVACAHDCTPQVCDQGQCVDACSGGRTACSGSCFDLSSSAEHCGTCDRACPVPAFSQAACRGGNCDFTCDGAHYRCGDQCCANQAGDAGGDGAVTPTTAVAVSAGFEHTCAVTKEGRVLCWGKGDDGQLGDGNAASSKSPVYVSGITAGASAVCAGFAHSCAVVGGVVKCWGDGFYGQLGNGGNSGSPKPVTISLGNATAVACGQKHTCALVTGGALKCWGDNSDGQLGNGNLPTGSGVPVDVTNMSSGVVQVSAGSGHNCALANGAAWCWGLNAVFQAGGSTNAVDKPNIVISSGVVAVAAGLQTSCMANASHITCWGYNGEGQIIANGDGEYSTPTDVTGSVSGTVGLGKPAIGAGHVCALGTDAYCWGDDRLGQQGTGTISGMKDRTPAKVISLTAVSALSAGQNHTCALEASGKVFCWGSNDQGQLGDPTAPPATAAPTEVQGL